MYRLLIVDDEPLTRDYLRTHLALLHPEWQFGGEAEDGREAIDLLEDGLNVDLIVTDIKMPVMDGLELARCVRRRFPEVRMVILSGYDEFILAKEAMGYGVDEYLLKPVVREELIAMLGTMAGRLAEDRRSRIANQALVNLSETTKSQIAGQFLQAVVSDNQAEIKTLYPMLFRMKISLIEAEGAILTFGIDEGELLLRDIAPAELVMFRYILHQTTTELGQSLPGVTVFFDGAQRTNALVPGDDIASVIQSCQSLFSEVRGAMEEMTGIRVWGAMGHCDNEPLQLVGSYRNAQQMLKLRLFAANDRLFEYNEGEAGSPKLLLLDKSMKGIRAGLENPLDSFAAEAVRSFAGLIPVVSVSSIMRFGSYLVEKLAVLPDSGLSASAETLLSELKAAARRLEGLETTAAEAALLFRRVLTTLTVKPGEPQPADLEHNIVKRAKAYILDHYSEPLSLALIAEKVGVSPGYLSGLFHQSQDESYIKFLTRVRMEHAAKLLGKMPAEKVYDVSEKVGYVSVKHFSYVFKQYLGMPPGEFQEKMLG